MSEDKPKLQCEPGESLSAYIAREGPLAPREALLLFLSIVSALEHAHKQGVLHRDLKPSNLLLRKDQSGNLETDGKLVDFGIAKVIAPDSAGNGQPRLTGTGEVCGSAAYMSPEHCLGLDLDSRADIYSLGCLMYEALSGKPPHCGSNALELLITQMNMDAPPLPVSSSPDSLLEGFEHILHKCLQPDRDTRYISVTELHEDLKALASHEALKDLNCGARISRSMN